MVSPAELGFLRAQGPKGIFDRYSMTNYDVVYDPRSRSKVVIVPCGAISESNLVGLVYLVEAQRQEGECVIPRYKRDSVYDMVDEMLRKGIAFRADHGRRRIPVSEIGQTELTSKLFSDPELGMTAENYADWLEKQGKDGLLISFSRVVDRIDPLYLNRLRVFGPGLDFGVGGSYKAFGVNFGKVFGVNFGAFGVRFEKTAEDGAKK